MPVTPQFPKVTTPTTLVLFGATGALARRKLYPTLLKLKLEGLLPDDFRLVGVSRQNLTDEVFRAHLLEAMEAGTGDRFDATAAREIAAAATQIPGDVRSNQWARQLGETLHTDDANHHVIFYLAIAPSLFASVITTIGEAGLPRAGGAANNASIVIEKPFGHDRASAHKLNELLSEFFREEQIYRMDHYLGKDTVQNILAFRFENGLFEPIWNRHNIDHVQITLAEMGGIGSRGRYYEEAGALRDVIQNHLLQLVAHVAMEPPADLSAEQLRDRRASVLRCLRPLQPSELDRRLVRGQYGPGQTLVGEDVPGYLDEEFVADGSTTESFVALPVELMNERWIGVPFYLRAGKRLQKDVTEITIQFRPSQHDLYHKSGFQTANLLTLRIQPNEGIALRLFVKKPGYTPHLDEVDMSFCYRDAFAGHLPEAYDRLLLDTFLQDQSLFTRTDEIERSWGFLEPILEHWSRQRPPEFPNYPAGSWGPKAADDLIEADGRKWWSDRLDVCPIPGAGQAVPVVESNKRSKA